MRGVCASAFLNGFTARLVPGGQERVHIGTGQLSRVENAHVKRECDDRRGVSELACPFFEVVALARCEISVVYSESSAYFPFVGTLVFALDDVLLERFERVYALCG